MGGPGTWGPGPGLGLPRFANVWWHLSQLHNVTLALDLLKDEGLLTYPVNPEGECAAHVGVVASGDSLWSSSSA